jgi:hypothetical protein
MSTCLFFLYITKYMSSRLSGLWTNKTLAASLNAGMSGHAWWPIIPMRERSSTVFMKMTNKMHYVD